MLSRFVIFMLALLVVMVAGELSRAQARAADYRAAIKANCAKELKVLCKGVREGGGRVLACLYSREDKLGAKCAATVASSQESLADALNALANVRRVCEADARRQFDRLSFQGPKKAVSQTCNSTLDAAFLRP